MTIIGGMVVGGMCGLMILFLINILIKSETIKLYIYITLIVLFGLLKLIGVFYG